MGSQIVFRGSTLRDIVPAVDRVQGKATTNLLTRLDLLTAVVLLRKASPYGKSLVKIVSAYQSKADEYPVYATTLCLTDLAGTVTRAKAPTSDSPYRYQLSIFNPTVPPKEICGMVLWRTAKNENGEVADYVCPLGKHPQIEFDPAVSIYDL